MLSALVEAVHAFYEQRVFGLFVFAILYFWFVWGVKIFLLLRYRPTLNDFRTGVSVVMPVYNENRDVLAKAVGLVIDQAPDLVPEIVVVIDSREAGIREWLTGRFGHEERLRIVETFDPGKRFSLALGIRSATREIVVSVESDVFVNESSISELVKPFADPRVGGVVGDQPTWKDLVKQQTRWFRNTGRRTSRALLWDGLWVWKRYPLAAWNMVTTWTNTVMVGAILFAVVLSLISRSWFWFGTDARGIAMRLALIVVSITLTRFIRSYPGLRSHPRRKWLWIFLLPWYGLVLWGVKVYAFFTMNRQGWVTRGKRSGAGGFEGVGPRLEAHVAAPLQALPAQEG